MSDRNRKRIMNQLIKMYDVGEQFTTIESMNRLHEHIPMMQGKANGTYLGKYIPSTRELGSWLGRHALFVRLNAGEQPAEWQRVEEESE